MMKLSILLVIASCLSAITTLPTGEQIVAVTQDTLGNYKLKLNIHGLARTEQGNADGSVNGGYSYYDPEGVLRTIQYTAGEQGFKAIGNHLPVAPLPVGDTAEVAAAKAAHLDLLAKATN